MLGTKWVRRMREIVDRYYQVTSRMWSITHGGGVKGNPRQGERFFLLKKEYEDLSKEKGYLLKEHRDVLGLWGNSLWGNNPNNDPQQANKQ